MYLLQKLLDKNDYKIICDFIIDNFQERRLFIYQSGLYTSEINLA